MKHCPISMTVRRRQISATAPAGSENSKIGRATAACTRATISGEEAIEVMSHEAPTACTRLPKFDTRLAIHTAANSRSLRGTRVDEPRSAANIDAPGTLGFMLMGESLTKVCFAVNAAHGDVLPR